MFKGETLRSMLLNAYGWWKVSQITYIASLVTFGLGGLTLAGRRHLRRRAQDRPQPQHSRPRSRSHDTGNHGNDNSIPRPAPPGAGRTFAVRAVRHAHRGSLVPGGRPAGSGEM